MPHERFVTVRRTDLIEIFKTWNQQADEGGWWDNPNDPEAQADHFLELAEKRQGGDVAA